MSRSRTIALVLGGLSTAAVGVSIAVWRLLRGLDRPLKDIEPDTSAMPGKTGYKRVDAILPQLRAAAQASGIPLGLMVGWIAKESGGKLSDTTSLDERGYFQLMPDESKALGLDHQRLSTDSDYSINAGVLLIRHYQSTINDLMAGVTSAGTSFYWRLVKLAHSMGAGQVKKVVNAAKAAGLANSWDVLEQFAMGTSIKGPQPKKWFPFVDSVYSVGHPFGFGSESTAIVGEIVDLRERASTTMRGLELLGCEEI